MVLFTSNEDVAACLDMETTIELMGEAYTALAEGQAVNINRADMLLPFGENEAYVFKSLPGMVGGDMETAAIRIQSDIVRWEEGRKYKVPLANDEKFAQYIEVFDTETGTPTLVMADGYVDKMRVGGTNALAAKYMARSDSRRMGLLGSGWQAGTMAWGHAEVLDLEEILVYSPTTEHREGFADEWNDRLDPDVVAVESAREAFEGSDVVGCATGAMEPVFDAEWVESGMHICSIKNPEVPDEVFSLVDGVVVNTNEQVDGPDHYVPVGSNFADALNEAWDVEGFDLSAAPELKDIVDGSFERGGDETSLFQNNLGTGIQFAAVGAHVDTAARERDLGTEVDDELFLQRPEEAGMKWG